MSEKEGRISVKSLHQLTAISKCSLYYELSFVLFLPPQSVSSHLFSSDCILYWDINIYVKHIHVLWEVHVISSLQGCEPPEGGN